MRRLILVLGHAFSLFYYHVLALIMFLMPLDFAWSWFSRHDALDVVFGALAGREDAVKELPCMALACSSIPFFVWVVFYIWKSEWDSLVEEWQCKQELPDDIPPARRLRQRQRRVDKTSRDSS